MTQTALTRYQQGLETLNGSNIVSSGIEDIHYKFHKISLNLG